MKNFELLPTEQNVIEMMKNDSIGRNKDLGYMYELLMAASDMNSIAIDGHWGCGKTFFVKQLNLIINAQNKNSSMNAEQKQNILSYVPNINHKNNDCAMSAYYDAWENDNDTDPLLSIVYELAKQYGMMYIFDKDTNAFKLAGAIIKEITKIDVNAIIDNLNSDNPFSQFKEEKELSSLIHQFFEDIMEERGNRLIIFIDELDRCKPDYAVRLIEKIKHYFIDSNITVVFAINLEQLQHTIKKCYGESFDASRYLDRFFDLRIPLPKVDNDNYFRYLGLNLNYKVEDICSNFVKQYNFQLREINRYYSQVRIAVYGPTHDPAKWDFSFQEGRSKKFILLFVVPILIGLHIIDLELYEDFIQGKNPKPMINLLIKYKYDMENLLNHNECFDGRPNMEMVDIQKKVEEVYNAIFNFDDKLLPYGKCIGQYEFDSGSKDFALNAVSMLSEYAEYE